MPRDLSELQEHFGNRFETSRLVSVDELFWPVFCHSFRYSVRKIARLNPVEEGLLRVVAAGVRDPAEASRFLGAGQKYIEHLAKRLSDTGEGYLDALVSWKEGLLGVTPQSEKALEACTRQELQLQELLLYRDGIVGAWLECGEDELAIVPKPDVTREPGRWLAARKSSICSKEDHTLREKVALSEVAGNNEVVTFSLAADGVLRWISLSIACYQTIDGRGSTFLLFNPAQDDKPLEELSSRFQELLEETEHPSLYFPNDPAKSSLQFWSRITESARTAKLQQKVKQQEAKRVETEARCAPIITELTGPVAPTQDPASGFAEAVFIADQCLRSGQPSEGSVAYRRAFECLIALLLQQPASEVTPERMEQVRKSDTLNDEQRKSLDQRAQWYRDLAADFATIQEVYGERLSKSISDELWELRSLARKSGIDESVAADFRQSFDELEELRQEVTRLSNLIEQAPTVEYLQAADHPAILKKALREATSSIVIISPWVKLGVVSRLMNDFRNALGRGVNIWVGYGMPDSSRRDDKSDPKAIEKLRQLALEGYLFLIKFGRSLREQGTHEKILIQDQDVCVIGSYNWLSYEARDNTRREMSILIKGKAYVGGFQSQIMRHLQEAGCGINNGRRTVTVTS